MALDPDGLADAVATVKKMTEESQALMHLSGMIPSQARIEEIMVEITAACIETYLHHIDV